jgi:hypothetical protein
MHRGRVERFEGRRTGGEWNTRAHDRRLTAVRRLRAGLLIRPSLLRLLNEVLAIVRGVLELGGVRLLLECASVRDPVEHAAEKRGVADNLSHVPARQRPRPKSREHPDAR